MVIKIIKNMHNGLFCFITHKKKADYEAMKEFGKSEEFQESVTHALKGEKGIRKSISDYLEASFQVAACDYEFGSSWGTKVIRKNPKKIFTFEHQLCVLI